MNCGIPLAFICKKVYDNIDPVTHAPTVPPTGGCPTNWIKLDNRCYHVEGISDEQKETWQGARDKCGQLTDGGILATIHSQQTQCKLHSGGKAILSCFVAIKGISSSHLREQLTMTNCCLSFRDCLIFGYSGVYCSNSIKSYLINYNTLKVDISLVFEINNPHMTTLRSQEINRVLHASRITYRACGKTLSYHIARYATSIFARY